MALQVNYEATLRSRTLRPLTPDARPERVAPLTPVEKKLYLAEEREIDFGQDPVKKWLKTQGLVRDGKESDIALARRVFLKIRAGFGYEYKGEMDRRASNVCTVGKSDCGGLAALFVAAMRANGVPARMLYGRWAESARADDQLGGVAYYQWHVKAEFHADGVGWVPVDLSSAILHDRSDEGLQYFGKDRGDFLTFHVDADLLLDTVHFGLIPMQNLQIPAWWVTGKGTVAGHKATQDWKVTPVK